MERKEVTGTTCLPLDVRLVHHDICILFVQGRHGTWSSQGSEARTPLPRILPAVMVVVVPLRRLVAVVVLLVSLLSIPLRRAAVAALLRIALRRAAVPLRRAAVSATLAGVALLLVA